MKKITMLLVALLATIFTNNSNAQTGKDYLSGGVFLIGFENHETPRFIDYYKNSLEKGYQQMSAPRFLMVSKDNNFVLGIGGFVNFRTGYNFNNVIDSKDFVTYLIPMGNTPQNKQEFLMDASTSRIGLHLASTNGKLRGLVANIEMDFRGSNNTVRLRQAYIKYKGFLAGQTVTTFSDPNATPFTIDFEGPSGYIYKRQGVIRYSRKLTNRLSMAVAAEMPTTDMTMGENTQTIPQRVPDFPIYIQYNMGRGNKSHIRLSAIFRDLVYYNDLIQDNVTKLGWGAQLSGKINTLDSHLALYFDAVYGEGIGQYIQDTQGHGFDLMPNNTNNGYLDRYKSLGVVAGATIKITNKITSNLVYSMANVYGESSNYDPNRYKKGQYFVGNIVWDIIPSCYIGIEYLHGSRQNFDKKFGAANTIQAAVKYNF